ncbi:hypothetical protein PVAP13_9NG152400 [Panicum virgatum]|uniref:Uncharacterized protein n=1 Tax=Panicum virgatum TaxID=38727 RepID=A0A8T0MFA2_PANVG|nr:hypothetical protein PVAP13_9NG152400 [Panicum virgatum]
MSPLPGLLPIVLLAAAATAAAAQAGGVSLNGAANDLLPKYGLPKGLIPDSVASYTFDEAAGAFEIHLASTCYVHFGSHLVYYERTITGKLSKGAISDLSGVQAKKLFLWVYVTGMVAHPDKGTIEFQRRRAAARRGGGDRGARPAPRCAGLNLELRIRFQQTPGPSSSLSPEPECSCVLLCLYPYLVVAPISNGHGSSVEMYIHMLYVGCR